MHFKDIARGFAPFARTMSTAKGTWLLATKGDGLRTFFKTHQKELTPEQRAVISKMRVGQDEQGSSMSLVLIEALATCLRDGPKIFCPTDEQFESMQHVDINIPFADYKQPYPVMVVKLPNVAKRRLAELHNLNPSTAPTWCLVYTRSTETGGTLLVINVMFPDEQIDFRYVLQDRAEFATVEDGLCLLHGDTDTIERSQQRFSQVVARSCLNLMLMMTHYGYRDAGPLHPKEHAKHKRAGRSCSEDFRTVDMLQDIVVREHSPGHGEESVPTGTEKIPHWRRGHWRIQRFGPGWCRSKTIFLKPQLIRRDRVVGDLSDSEAIYTGRTEP